MTLKHKKTCTQLSVVTLQAWIRCFWQWWFANKKGTWHSKSYSNNLQ